MEDELTCSSESTATSTVSSESKQSFSKMAIQKLINLNDINITYESVDTRNSNIKSRTKRVVFNLMNTPFIKCNDCSNLITYTNNTKPANRHFENCLSSSSSKHAGKIISHLFTNKLPSDLKSNLASKRARVCLDDVRTFTLFNGKAFKDYCQELINIGATYGKLDYDNVGPDKKTIKNHTMKNAITIKEILTFLCSFIIY